MQSLLNIYGLFALVLFCLSGTVGGIEIDYTSAESIRRGASTIAFDMMSYYQGNLTGFTPGVLPGPYYWWQSGAMWGSMINYWAFTGDSTYNAVVSQALLQQVGDNEDYMPKEHRSSLGNDDQGFWAVSALMAAENNFPDPPADKPSWLGLAQAVFNEQIGRWDNTTCAGGLRWQIYVKNGYSTKNTISNGLLFNIASRLARYTGDQMYADWAVKVWDWMWAINLIDHKSFNVYDNSEADLLNCTELDRNQWSYNAGVLLGGASTMYNITDGADIWRNRTQRLLNRIEEFFFINGTMIEICERVEKCNDDQKSFKAYLSRWMTSASQLAPFTHPQVHRLLTHSAKDASSQCTGGPRSTACGIKWWLNGTFDGQLGVGQQMSALEIVLSTLVALEVPGNSSSGGGSGVKPPVTGNSGGTSAGKPDAGADYNSTDIQLYVDTSTMKDRAGAWAVTGVLVLACLGASWFLWSDVLEGGSSVAAGKKGRSRGKGARRGSGNGGGVLGFRREKVVDAGSGSGSGSASGGSVEGNGMGVGDRGLRTIGESEGEIEGEEKPVPKYRGGNMAT